jgi:hypothetical protein
MNNKSIESIQITELSLVIGGTAAQPAASQQELRTLAQQYCPATYAKVPANATITRPMAERCLDEAGYGAFKGRLDKYFPK